MTHFKGVLAHTSGAVEMLDRSGSSGVFYPLQTFSKNADLQISNIPFCIEGNDETSRKALHTLANKLSTNVQFVTSAQRSEIHLAAVFACNFTNHMWRISADILEKSDLELSILQPLISETFKKALTKGPKISQTGPAARNDKKILRKQLLRLDPYPFWKKIYLRVSKSIINDTNE